MRPPPYMSIIVPSGHLVLLGGKLDPKCGGHARGHFVTNITGADDCKVGRILLNNFHQPRHLQQRPNQRHKMVAEHILNKLYIYYIHKDYIHEEGSRYGMLKSTFRWNVLEQPFSTRVPSETEQ